MSDEYYEGVGKPEEIVKGNRFKHAWKEAMDAVQQSPSLGKIYG